MNNAKCATPSCTAACPAGVDVPRYVSYIRDGDFSSALAVIREKIPFPAVCGYACIHPCESRCARVQYDEPVAIRLLKRAALEYGDEGKAEEKPVPTGKKVAIVGSGPCGLTAAYFLAGKGHTVRVYEALPQPGGMLRYGIPEYRLPNRVLGRDIDLITRRGVEIVTDTRITSADNLLADGFNAVLVTVGAWQSQKAGIEGEQEANVLDGIALLKQVNTGGSPAVGNKVVVIGGGNTAIDAARSAVRLGSQVTLLYRRTLAQMPAAPEEVKAALEEGVEIKFLTAPVKVNKHSITSVRMALGPADAAGRPAPVPVEGSEFDVECDTVIMAVGQAVDAGSLNLEANSNGTVKVNSGLETGTKGIYAAGDAVTGPSSIIESINQGRQASQAIDSFLGGTGVIDGICAGARLEMPEEAPRGTYRPEVKEIPVSRRVSSFDLVESGFERETAMQEARRCLACDTKDYRVAVNDKICKGCGYCKEVCSLGIFEITQTFNSQGYKPAEAQNPDSCIGCLKCLYVCPDFAISVEKTS